MRTRLKKTVILLLIGMLAGAFLLPVGCTPPTPEPPAEELQVWVPDWTVLPWRDTLKPVFEAETGIELVIVGVPEPEISESFVTAVEEEYEECAPHMVMLQYEEICELAEMGYLEDLTEYRGYYEREGLVPAEYMGKIYGVTLIDDYVLGISFDCPFLEDIIDFLEQTQYVGPGSEFVEALRGLEGLLTVETSANPDCGFSPLTVQFSASASGTFLTPTYYWDFGDGGTSTDQNPTHTYHYGTTGTCKDYTATVTASTLVQSDDDSVTVKVCAYDGTAVYLGEDKTFSKPYNYYPCDDDSSPAAKAYTNPNPQGGAVQVKAGSLGLWVTSGSAEGWCKLGQTFTVYQGCAELTQQQAYIKFNLDYEGWAYANVGEAEVWVYVNGGIGEQQVAHKKADSTIIAATEYISADDKLVSVGPVNLTDGQTYTVYARARVKVKVDIVGYAYAEFWDSGHHLKVNSITVDF